MEVGLSSGPKSAGECFSCEERPTQSLCSPTGTANTRLSHYEVTGYHWRDQMGYRAECQTVLHSIDTFLRHLHSSPNDEKGPAFGRALRIRKNPVTTAA